VGRVGCFGVLECERWLRLVEWAMLVPELHCAVIAMHRFLVEKKPLDTRFHIHIAAASTYSNAVIVRGNASATPKQALKKVANCKKQLPPITVLWKS
jgi:hypothetical protein